VTVYARHQSSILTENDELSGGDVLPGFRLAVREAIRQ